MANSHRTHILRNFQNFNDKVLDFHLKMRFFKHLFDLVKQILQKPFSYFKTFFGYTDSFIFYLNSSKSTDNISFCINPDFCYFCMIVID